MKRALGLFVGALVMTGTSGTQTVSRIELPDGVVLTEGQFVAVGGAPAPAAKPAEEKQEPAKPTPREEALKKVNYDRRPSTILKAWSTPPEPGDEPAEDEAKEEAAPPVTVEAASEPDEAADSEEAEENEEGDGEPEKELTEEEKKAAEEAAEKAEEERKKAEQAAKRAAEAAAEAARKEAEKKAIEDEIATLQRNVTLGRWDEVGAYLNGLTEAEGKAGYAQMLKSLVKGPKKPQGRFAQWAEKNHFEPRDVVGLATAAPIALEGEMHTQIGQILRQCVDGGSLVERAISLFHGFLAESPEPVLPPVEPVDDSDGDAVEVAETGDAEAEVAGADEEPKLTAGLKPQDVARILMEASFPVEAGEFLPTPEDAVAANDRSALNLLSRHYLAKHAEDEKGGFLERAWTVIQAVLDHGEVEEKEKEEALARAVEIAPKIGEELGQVWLDQSFTERPERGMEILSVIGSKSASGLMDQAREADTRFKGLRLQTTAAEALLKAAPELATEWADALTVLASNWLTEAVYTYQNDTSTQRGPTMQRDYYGNYYWYNYRNRTNQNVPEAITTDQMLEIRPSEDWLAHVDDGIKPKFAMVLAQLLLKVQDEEEAFPFIESLAASLPDRAKELVEEFLRVWTKNHDPNANQRRSSYIYFYGYEQRADAIPLTRSKQERNLEELAGWIARINKLELDGVDETLVANAFTGAHSVAEVYRLETIERVFGALDSLEPKTLSQLIQKMRENLVGVWRQPATQKDNKTNRRQRDIQSEVLRGYEVARNVAEKGLVDYPGDWRLMLAKASVLHDENNFRAEIAKSAEFTSRRHEAFGAFARAAEAYAAKVDELTEQEEKTDVFETWFYASLGACDLGAVDEKMVPVEAQVSKIGDAIRALPAAAADRHMEKFANTLFSRMGSVNPAVKYGYARHGLQIVGDHERARDCREVYDYYNDLTSELTLVASVDGDDQVGHEKPFGLWVSIRHTKEIEREAGGFGKYLTNQNQNPYSYNYGRPTENYRDKFEDATREALDEHFEVLSVTFNHPESNSRALPEYGWRETPYAYVLLKARGPEVDRIPPLHVDMDFLDTSGYAVLPIESSAVAIDASAPRAEPAPFKNLRLTQTLDERQAAEGKLILEVQASAHGLVPELASTIDLAPEGFDVVAVDDQGVSVSKFDEEAEDVEVVTERIWMVTMQAKEALDELPKEFQFGRPAMDETLVAEVDYQRYDDADLESVEPVISLVGRYGKPKGPPILAWTFGTLALVGLGAAAFIGSRRMRVRPEVQGPFRMPDSISPFTVIGLLQSIEARDGLSAPQKEELRSQITRLEGFYFDEQAGDTPDLKLIAETWVHRVS